MTALTDRVCPIPELAELPVWLLWKSIPNGKDKPRKVPFYADGTPRRGALDSPEDRARLVDYKTAAAACTAAYAGLGIALGPVPGEDIVLSGIDLDNVLDEAGDVDPRAEAILAAAGSYAEISPSGKGIKIFGFGAIGTAKRLNCNAGLEIYCGGRYFTVTGNRVNRASLAGLHDAARVALEQFPVEVSAQPEQKPGGAGPVHLGGRNSYLSGKAYALRRDGATPEQILPALRAINDSMCDPPLSDDEVAAIARGKAQVQPEARPEPPPRPFLKWPELTGLPPPREWDIDHWLPRGKDVLLAGRGGIGKTLLAQMMGTALATGREYIDATERRTVLLWAGEDDADELWRRQMAINTYFEVGMADLQRLHVASYCNADITLAGLAMGALTPTPLMDDLRQQVHDLHAEVVFLDNVARIYGGNENDRHQVTQFMAWLRAAVAPASLVVLAHPAKAAGSEFSGSTAWEGAVRARLWLSDRMPDAEPTEDCQPDDTQRFLARRKANYAANDVRRLTFSDGVLVPDSTVRRVGVSGEFVADVVRRAVRALADKGLHGTTSTASPSYLPKLAQQYGLLESATKGQFQQAMRTLVMQGELVNEVVGKYSNRAPRMGLVLK